MLLLPQLASFFDVTLDELVGYEAQLSQEQIRKIYGTLCESFIKLPLEKAIAEARIYAHRYYSCYPFLLQMGILYLNHFMLADTREKQEDILTEADSFCTHILERCHDTSICEDAWSLKAMICIQLGKSREAEDILEELTDPIRISEQNDLLLVQAYLQNGKTEQARNYTQIRTYLNLLNLLSAEILSLSLYENHPERCKETIQRIKSTMELYHLEKLHQNLAAQLYYQMAVFYGTKGKSKEALEELSGFEKCVCPILENEQFALHGDAYFDRLDEWIERLPLGDMTPRDKHFAKQSALQALSHPAFTILKENNHFKQIYHHILEGGDKNA